MDANPVFGTAHLFGMVTPAESRSVLGRAHQEGFRHFDTAPSYGYGRSEAELGLYAAHLDPPPTITTKVGIKPASPPARSVRLAKAVARRLPATLQQRLRGDARPAGHGQFGTADVLASIETSLSRLGRLDRLVLHEVRPDDITEELLSCLRGFLARGDVGQLGVATANDLTRDCLDRSPEMFQVAHFSAGPLSPPVLLPDTVTVRVGHGVLGPSASHLTQLQARLDSGVELGAEWREVTAGTAWAGPSGLADALIARSATLGLTDVIVATSRPERLAPLRRLVLGHEPPPEPVHAVLNRLISG